MSFVSRGRLSNSLYKYSRRPEILGDVQSMSIFENGFSEVSLTLNLVVSINGHLQHAYVKMHVSENPESNFF
jgi:hypothetical protein